MSRRPPSTRDPEKAFLRLLPALGKAVPGHLQSRAATPLPRPLPQRQATSATGGWTPELIITGYARVAANIAPPGLRVPFACTLNSVYLRAGTAPTGASLILLVKLSSTTLATLTIAASGTSTSSTGLSVVLAAGDIVTFDITQIGSTVAGADMAVQLTAA